MQYSDNASSISMEDSAKYYNPEAGKPAQLAESYRIISLLPLLSKLFVELLLPRFSVIMERRKIIPNHQFGFRHKHGTIEQIYRIVKRISININAGRY